MIEFTFWLCIALLAHIYFLYPWTLRIFAFFRKRFGNGNSEVESGELRVESGVKSVSIIIAAHNEEAVIEAKINNTLELNYPQMEILIGDDGSTDKTAEIVAKFPEVRLIRHGTNDGKAAMLNYLFQEATGEILVFSDANTMLDSSALENLVAKFADESVGCVCGKLSLIDESGYELSETESIYWSIESNVKHLESCFGAVMGSNGALYAIRASLYPGLPTHKTVMDDFYITVKILMKNYLCVFCENALAFETTSTSKFGEFKRKIRIGRANFNFLSEYLPLLSFRTPMKAYIFLSHKLLRWFSPFFLLILFFSSTLLLQNHVFYKLFLTAELMFTVTAFLGVKVSNYFLSMNLALLIGFCKLFKKEKSGAWERVERV